MSPFEQMGDLLKQQAKHWAARYDERTGSWEILDLWHPSLASLSPDDDVPDTSPALKVIQADAFDVLLTEANRLGVLTRWVGPRQPVEAKKELELEQKQKEPSEAVSEVPPKQAGNDAYFNYRIQLEVIASLERLAASSNIKSLAKSK